MSRRRTRFGVWSTAFQPSTYCHPPPISSFEPKQVQRESGEFTTARPYSQGRRYDSELRSRSSDWRDRIESGDSLTFWSEDDRLPFIHSRPPSEQAAIVRYLDHVDRRISRYIRAKQRLIELLEEEKQAIIHRAVTRGLDPNVRLKPSGVEWLGDVPEHWECRETEASPPVLVERRSETNKGSGRRSCRFVGIMAG